MRLAYASQRVAHPCVVDAVALFLPVRDGLRPAWARGAALAVLLALALPGRAAAHCDTLDGPVVRDARQALESGDPAVALKWVRAEAEPEVREAFQSARSVRTLGGEAKALADRYFFETLVRIHRQGEGAPYTGLKPAGAEVDTAIRAADRSLETGALQPLTRELTRQLQLGLRERFARASQARRRAGESTQAGREFVAAYVEFIHYAERLRLELASDAGHGPQPAAAPPHH